MGVFSELGAGSSLALVDRLGRGTHGFRGKLAYDHMALVWSPSFEFAEWTTTSGRRGDKTRIGKYVISDVGKYAGVILERGSCKVALLGVHSPKQKGKRQQSYRLMSEYIEQYGDDVDEVIVAGDFNGNQSQVSEYISGKFAFDETTTTTKSNLCLDNIVVQNWDYHHTLVDRSNTLFSHYPISGAIGVEV